MSEQILNKILEKLESLESEVKEIKAHTIEIPYIRQAVLETNEAVKRLEVAQRKTESELNNHSYSIDILNREQLYLKTEIEKLKNR
jgi:hypothetical protein